MQGFLGKLFIDITDNRELMKGLRRLEQKYDAEKRYTQLECHPLVEAAKARGQRYPWGEQIKPNDLSTNINNRYIVTARDDCRERRNKIQSKFIIGNSEGVPRVSNPEGGESMITEWTIMNHY